MPSTTFVTSYLESFRNKGAARSLAASPSIAEPLLTAGRLRPSGLRTAAAETEPAEPDASLSTPASAEGDEAFRSALARIRAHDYDAALQLLDKAVQKKTAYMAQALNARGTFLYLKGDLEAALSDFNAALSLEPSNINSLVKRGSIYMEMNNR